MIVNKDIYTGTEESLSSFQDSKRRIAEKELAIKDLENELHLLKLQALNNYKSAIAYFFPVSGNTITMARRWIKILEEGVDSNGKKLDKRKKYEEKEVYDTINSYLSHVLGKIIAVSKIIDYSYGQATIFEFSYEDIKFRLQVPNVSLVTLKAFEYEGEEAFKLSLHARESECCTKFIGSTFIEDELESIMDSYIEEVKTDE